MDWRGRLQLTYRVAERDEVHDHVRANLLELEWSENDFVRRARHHLCQNFFAVSESERHRFGNLFESGGPWPVKVEGIGEHHNSVRGDGTCDKWLEFNNKFAGPLESFLGAVKMRKWVSSILNVNNKMSKILTDNFLDFSFGDVLDPFVDLDLRWDPWQR